MSHERGIRAWLGTDDLPLTVAKLGVVASVLLLGLRLLVDQVFILVIPLAVGGASAVFLVTWHRRPLSVDVPSLPGGYAGYLPAVVVAGLAGLVLLTAAAGQRTVTVHLLTGAIGALVLAQVLLDERPGGLVLAQILLVGVVVRLSALFVTPGFVGVDIWTHVPVFVEGIVQAGSLSAIADSKYLMAPIYHVFGAQAALVFGDARAGVYLTVGLLVTLSSLFVFGTAELFLHRRGALLATALYVFADEFVRWGMHVIPTSLGLVFYLGALYAVCKVFLTDGDEWAVLLLAVFSLAIVFTHQVSTAILLVLLGLAFVVGAALDLSAARSTGLSVSRSTLAHLLVFVGTTEVTLWSWANTPFSGDSIFLWNRIEIILSAFSGARFLDLAGGGGDSAAGAAEATASLSQTIAPYVDVVGFTILLTAAVLGGLVMLDREYPVDATLTLLAVAATTFVVVFGLSIFGIRVLLPGRWLAFLYAPLVVLGAVGITYLSATASPRVVLAVVLLLAAGYPTSMAVAEKATLDSPAFDETYPRFSYTESEIAAAETIERIRPPALQPEIHSDHPYRTLFESRSAYRAEVLVMSQGTADADGAVVYRDYQATGPVVFHEPGPVPRTGFRGNYESGAVCPPGRDHVYANDRVRLCLPAATGPGGSP